ncbi:phosphate ABC transporter permease PstA [Streptococcus alactolyticus]|jgi:phosphate transport system permease protein|uniref:Phosphate transport system permease protein PstA n=1 Tax=Streptococcus alactolyticus TaxID=29389 RepID=A0ABY7M1D4_STRAY|nr:phosphate ABC transporter permease PstA [Streptococcus alactolyticus]MDE2587346.1 phosphate ABC transporter permease PstA [Lactobacillales bacterium]MCF2666573.1 phosphate ABC transporter permease PstA [Streptococcus alactolyticus]MCF2678828.1 phosphate ABC transporter permease PstA [Streptococcus alactolyticus]MDD7361143.1 phosphate ABC transporter permease PstA [Streptococcus alactolyticus]MDY5186938.1 phosphate ABC transporter permease PstA [Streptococcus alactolyticus]
MENVNQRTLKQRFASRKHDPVSLILFGFVYLAAFVSFLMIAFIISYILVKGVPHLNKGLFSLTYTTDNVSLLPALINTVFITILTLLIAVPIGIGGSIYLTEYAKRDNPIVNIIRIATETLSGIPSIIYGLFGALFFVKYAHFGLSLLSGAVTLSIMILPLIMKTTEEALLSVPNSYREGAFALGAGKLRTIFKIVLPSAMPGIFPGVILAIGRIIGESAALIFTAGTVAEVAKSVFSSSRTLAVHMYAISGEGLYINQTYATAVVLLILVIGINFLSGLIAKRLGSENG